MAANWMSFFWGGGGGGLTNFVPVDLAPFSRARKKKSSLFQVEHFSVTDDCSQEGGWPTPYLIFLLPASSDDREQYTFSFTWLCLLPPPPRSILPTCSGVPTAEALKVWKIFKGKCAHRQAARNYNNEPNRSVMKSPTNEISHPLQVFELFPVFWNFSFQLNSTEQRATKTPKWMKSTGWTGEMKCNEDDMEMKVKVKLETMMMITYSSN